MDRFAQGFASGLMLAAAALAAGCSGGASGLLGGTAPAGADAPGSFTDDNPAARPVAVAWTSARAQRCGFYFDPARLRSSYLAYEARQSGAEQAAKAEKAYDSTFRTIRERVAADPDYCSDGKSAEIKKDLTRHLAGDFTPNFPKTKTAETCWFFNCGGQDRAWTADRFWAEQAARQGGR
jgi:hypothetical protein